MPPSRRRPASSARTPQVSAVSPQKKRDSRRVSTRLTVQKKSPLPMVGVGVALIALVVCALLFTGGTDYRMEMMQLQKSYHQAHDSMQRALKNKDVTTATAKYEQGIAANTAIRAYIAAHHEQQESLGTLPDCSKQRAALDDLQAEIPFVAKRVQVSQMRSAWRVRMNYIKRVHDLGAFKRALHAFMQNPLPAETGLSQEEKQLLLHELQSLNDVDDMIATEQVRRDTPLTLAPYGVDTRPDVQKRKERMSHNSLVSAIDKALLTGKFAAAYQRCLDFNQRYPLRDIDATWAAIATQEVAAWATCQALVDTKMAASDYTYTTVAQAQSALHTFIDRAAQESLVSPARALLVTCNDRLRALK